MKKEHLKIEINKLKKWGKNPKKHKDDLIEKSIKEVGFVDDIVIDENNRILSGHGRLEALKKLGYQEIDTIRVSGLTEEQKEKYAILSNKSVEAGDWDWGLLSKIDREVLSEGGFKDEELDRIYLEDRDGKDELEKIIIKKRKYEVKRGDLFRLGNHRLLCGDGTGKDAEKLMGEEKADLVLTDPPYDFKIEDNFKNCFDFCDGRFLIFNSDKNSVLLANQYLKYFKYFLILYFKAPALTRNVKMPARNHNLISYFSKGKALNKRLVNFSSVIEVGSRYDRKDYHQHTKNIEIFNLLIRMFSHRGSYVLDLFGGFGTTLISCEVLGRKCYMMEIDETNCSLIIERWEKVTGQKAKKIEN